MAEEGGVGGLQGGQEGDVGIIVGYNQVISVGQQDFGAAGGSAGVGEDDADAAGESVQGTDAAGEKR